MARNAEKAQAMLNRWWSMKRKMRVEETKEMERPRYASECNSLKMCEKWRCFFNKNLIAIRYFKINFSCLECRPRGV